MKRLFTYTTSVILITLTIICILSPNISLFSLLSEYAVQFMFLTLFIGLLSLTRDNKKLLFTSFLCTAALALFLKSASNNDMKSPTIDSFSNLNIGHFNLSNFDRNTGEIINSIKSSNYDIISFQEYTPEWIDVINQEFGDLYKYSKKAVRIDPFGMAILSKYKLKKINTNYYNKIPNISIEIMLKNQVINIVLSYVLPPALNNSMQTTAKHLEFVGDFISKNNQPTILVGDFNMVYWSSEITQFRSMYNLNNSRKNITPAKLKIPYDHMFYTNELECSSFQDLVDKQGYHIGISGIFQLTTDNKNSNRYISFSN